MRMWLTLYIRAGMKHRVYKEFNIYVFLIEFFFFLFFLFFNLWYKNFVTGYAKF